MPEHRNKAALTEPHAPLHPRRRGLDEAGPQSAATGKGFMNLIDLPKPETIARYATFAPPSRHTVATLEKYARADKPRRLSHIKATEGMSHEQKVEYYRGVSRTELSRYLKSVKQ